MLVVLLLVRGEELAVLIFLFFVVHEEMAFFLIVLLLVGEEMAVPLVLVLFIRRQRRRRRLIDAARQHPQRQSRQQRVPGPTIRSHRSALSRKERKECGRPQKGRPV